MFSLENELNGLHGQARREQVAEIGQRVVAKTLCQAGLLGRIPEDVTSDLRPFFELARLNWRLIREGYAPLSPDLRNGQLNQLGKTPRRLQFELLGNQGLLIPIDF